MHTIPPNVDCANVMYVPDQSTHVQYNVSIVTGYMVQYPLTGYMVQYLV